MAPARAAVSRPGGPFSTQSSQTLAPARAQAADPGPLDAGGWGLHRPRRPAALWRHQPVLGHRVMAPSTLGTFLRAFTFGHVRQLDRLAETVLARAWTAGVGPGDGPMTMDLDSTVCEVHGHAKQGAAYGYTHKLGHHPLLTMRADSGFWSAKTIRACRRHQIRYSITVRQKSGINGRATKRMLG